MAMPDNPPAPTAPAPAQARPTPKTSTAPARPGRAWGAWILIALFAAAAIYVAVGRFNSANRTEKATVAMSVPSVNVVAPKISKADVDLVLPGNVVAFADTPIFARTDGYVKRWLVDIGATVKAGQLLAEIDSPEVDQQLQQAQAAVNQAESNVNLASVTAQRWKEMLQRQTVSQQETDEKQSALTSDQASLNSAQANVRRLQELKSFEQVVAPFDGRITERKVNVGDLITAGSSGTEIEMFRLAQDNVLRVYTNIPEVNAGQVKVGQTATVELASSPTAPAKGRVAHLAGAIDPTSRTRLAEIEVDNANHDLLAGGYATVHVPIHSDSPALVIPVNTMLFRPQGTVVGVVDADGNVHLQAVEIGRDFGTTVEIKSGLQPTDRIILNPSDSLQDGDHVQVASPKETPAAK